MTENNPKMDENDNKVSVSKLTSRRGLLKKAAIGAPIVMVLANRPAYGAVCSISGFQSINPSGVQTYTSSGCGGFSPGGWKNPDVGHGNSDGNRSQWIIAGYYPNPRAGVSPPDHTASIFSDVFGRNAPGFSSTATLQDVLLNSPGSLEFHAIANLLNAGYFADYRLSQADVIGLYNAWVSHLSTYTTTSGTVVQLSQIEANGGLKKFFDQYH